VINNKILRNYITILLFCIVCLATANAAYATGCGRQTIDYTSTSFSDISEPLTLDFTRRWLSAPGISCEFKIKATSPSGVIFDKKYTDTTTVVSMMNNYHFTFVKLSNNNHPQVLIQHNDVGGTSPVSSLKIIDFASGKPMLILYISGGDGGFNVAPEGKLLKITGTYVCPTCSEVEGRRSSVTIRFDNQLHRFVVMSGSKAYFNFLGGNAQPSVVLPTLKSTVETPTKINSQPNYNELENEILNNDVKAKTSASRKVKWFTNEVYTQIYNAWKVIFSLHNSCVILFHLNKSGKIIGQPQLIKSSGNPNFDQSAISAVIRAAPFHPPKGLSYSIYKSILVTLNSHVLNPDNKVSKNVVYNDVSNHIVTTNTTSSSADKKNKLYSCIYANVSERFRVLDAMVKNIVIPAGEAPGFTPSWLQENYGYMHWKEEVSHTNHAGSISRHGVNHIFISRMESFRISKALWSYVHEIILTQYPINKFESLSWVVVIQKDVNPDVYFHQEVGVCS
jgi:TonB family protein